jgi:gamma-butyrobetaine dioxygenase
VTGIEAIAKLFAGPGSRDYLGEAAGAPAPLVAAALLHDVGHLRHEPRGGLGGSSPRDSTDARHGTAGAQWLGQWFGPAVTEPVRLHVAAKRYLCATEPGYLGLLSAESVRTLALQGGPMTPEQAAAFGALPCTHDAVAVRRWDDQAKDPAVTPPEFGQFEALLTALLKPGPLSSEACGRAR